jgi:ABC-2 type transport system permease protein
MTTTTLDSTAEDSTEGLDDSKLQSVLGNRVRPGRAGPVSASLTFGWRAMLKIKHVPEQLFDVTMFPIMFTLLFTYLFGGALEGSPTEYIQVLAPGILVQTVVFITMYAGMGLNNDIKKGVFDRFRSLPIWRPAPMVGLLLGRYRPDPGLCLISSHDRDIRPPHDAPLLAALASRLSRPRVRPRQPGRPLSR